MSACKVGGGHWPETPPSTDHPRIAHSSPLRTDTAPLQRGTRDRGLALCRATQKPPSSAAGSLSLSMSPSPLVSHSGCTGHHHVVAIDIHGLAFSPQTKAQPRKGSRRVFCHLPEITSSLFSSPAPSPARNMSRTRMGQSSSSWDRNSLEFDNKTQKLCLKKMGKKRFRIISSKG